ncbi:type I-F CRISPR-associated protein Csy2 [Aromatoleum anaerobium]|uniref:Uncharacterized protein n=1 Tax=Aromatoleum anaerobium TaxID=182180 RepID=A0ABX1PQ03_9RHOO|nr:type I-F CRISPR-associated protein Csy2 [Aromatoleum anaerobium]MCK0506050.1 type I-F CRISPR-associated protein Csy2 [Aromatoleum anaerobium]
MSIFPESQGLLVLPCLRTQNANAISSPLTRGFPPQACRPAREFPLRTTFELREGWCFFRIVGGPSVSSKGSFKRPG